MKKGKRLKKTYSTYLWTYLIVLIIPLLFTFMGYLYAHNLVQDEINDIHFNILMQTRQSYDQIISVVDSQSYALISNSNIDSLKYKKEWEVKDLFSVQKLVSNLADTRNAVPYVDKLAVLFYENDSIVTDTRRYPSGLHDQFYSINSLDREEFLGSIDLSVPRGNFVIDNALGARYIFFYRNVYDVMYKRVVATILISVPISGISDIAANVELSEDGGIILYKGDFIVNSNIDLERSTKMIESLDVENETRMVNVDGKRYVASFVSSQNSNFRYCIYTARNYFYKNLIYLRVVIVGEILVCTILGILLSNFFATETFNPIEEMLSMLESKREESSDIATYDHLKASLMSMLDENEELEKSLKRSEDFARKGVFISALKGWNSASFIGNEVYKAYNSDFVDNNFRIVLFRAYRLDNCVLDLRSSEEEKLNGYKLIIFSMENVINDIFGNGKKCELTEIDEMIALFYKVNSEEEDVILEERIGRCLSFYRSTLGIDAFAAVSSIHEDASELSEAYDEAYQTVMHKNFWGSEVPDIVMYDNEIMNSESNKNIPKLMQNEKKLLNALITRDYKNANDILDDMIDTHLQKNIRLLNYNRYQAAGIVNTVFEVFEEMSVEVDAEFIEKINVQERLAKTLSVRALRTEIHSIFNEAIEYFDQKKVEDLPDWIVQVRQYLEDNYMDDSVNISAIADMFHMSLAHMGRTYKKYTGEGMLDYIHRIRLSHCKEMLDAGYTVKEAAETNGYIDSKAMIRAFKRYEGITPGQYKAKAIAN